MESRYETHVDPLAPNNAHALAVQLTGTGKRVLELGAASGYVTRTLRDRGNTVVCVEADGRMRDRLEEVADEVVISDLDWLDLGRRLAGRSFDVVIAGDVLEHCIEPDLVLLQVRSLIAPGGSLIVSLPNVAHVDVRLALLNGRFDYRPAGLLDRTHLRFFTRSSVETLLSRNGFRAEEWYSTHIPLGQTEIGPADPDTPPSAIDHALRDRDALIYQFVVKASVIDPPPNVAVEPLDPTATHDRLLAEVGLLRSVVAQRDDALGRDDGEIARLTAAVAEAQDRIRSNRERHRREIAALHAAPWSRIGRLLRRPWRVLARFSR